MKINEISELWKKDCDLDISDLATEALKIPKLHEKYYRIFIGERMLLKKMESDYKILNRAKWEYYSGKLSSSELSDYGWPVFEHKILRQDIPTYLDSDKDLIEILSRISVQKEKVEFLESIIKSLVNRGFQIKSAIDFIRFTNGN